MTLATARPACFPLLAAMLLVLMALPHGGAATPDRSAAPGSPPELAAAAEGPRSSLDIGPAFDEPSKAAFFAALTAAQRQAVVRLHSRFALADPNRPLPPSAQPTLPLYVQLNSDLTPAAYQALRAAGVAPIAYFYRHTYVLRAAGAEALPALERWLATEPAVLGSLRREPMDVCDPALWQWLAGEPVWGEWREVRLQVYSDVRPADAEALLAELAAEVLDATRDNAGRLTLATPYVDLALSRSALWQAARDPRVAYLEPLYPLATHNAGSVSLSRASVVKAGPYNLTGAGEVVAIWDGGAAQNTHPDFGGRVTLSTSSSISSHATHVMGTILGSGANNSNARGYAHEATGFSYSFNTNIPAGRRSRRHLSLHSADNHSYGSTGATFGSYNSTARTNDIDNRDLLMIQVQSAGNSGPGDTTIRADKGGKNDVIVGATNNSGTIASFSSRGPMLDGRLAPRITAKGASVTSALPTNGYGTMSGTSMSGPGVCGGMTLISQYFKQRNEGMPLPPDLALAVAALTADDRGNPGPDYVYGFGLLDVEASVRLIEQDADNDGRYIVRGVARQGSTNEYVFDVTDANEPLRFTLAYLDEAATSGAQIVLVNDLDLELVAPDGTIHHPYSGLTGSGSQTATFGQSGPNRRDNVELVVVDSPQVGTWRARVRAFSIPDPNTTYGYVLAGSVPVDRNRLRFVEPLGANGAPLPDGSTSGWTRTFTVTDTAKVVGVRAYAYVTHDDRNDLWVTLTGPDNTTLELERGVNGQTHGRTDLIGIFPDTRHFDDDVIPFYGLSAAGDWTLTISDRDGDSNTGSVRFVALEFDLEVPNEDPTLLAIGGGVYEIGEPVNLEALATDPDGHLLTYEWQQTAGPALPLSSTTTPQASLTTPSVSEITDYVYEITVRDGRGGEARDEVTVRVLPPNNSPVADAGPERSIVAGQQALLDGTGSSDPDNDVLTYTWVQLSGPAITLDDPNAVQPAFEVPDAIGEEVTFGLMVEDGRGGLDSDTVTLMIVAPPIHSSVQRGCGASGPSGAAVAPAWSGALAVLLALLALAFARRRFAA